eukprot:CAMPEP_0113376742 /NCGR_PEP_ID=MMETSP0013_2-20120614/2789_1 /TAXON_ID=2843 ORGANISM="Skeletonema costatum, Strain 1716" /NCGR_SAMPLE_ID=MMETSP0013_2 /ASSEMBLY_ACC=CAM_ASM_000158 /LENGTH=359 /DNA_ID=CAMNT_0000258839 /DNA_START=177 /DNA_END=1253 /DNA_ORIENTATION=+ /assembly_acc=CAM_ASM_000158
MPPPLYGQLVHVAPQNFVGRPNSEGGNGYVEKDHPDSGLFDIRYCMDGSVEKNVNRLRITSYNPLVTTARRTNGTDVARPSILAPSHQPQQRTSPLTQPPTPPTSPRGIQHIIIQSRGWSEYDHHPNPLLVHLRNGRSKPRAWLRIDEGEYDKYEKGTKKGEMKSHLNELENNKLVRIKSELERIILFFDRKQWPNGFTPHADLAYAYGVNKRKVRHCVNFLLRNNCSEKRKVRHDAGKTIFNSSKMRESTYTPYKYFKKLQRKNNPGVTILDKDLIVEEVQDGLDLEGGADNKLKYAVPNMEQHDISEHLTYDELAFIAGDVADADYDNFDDATKARYDKFVEAWYKKQDVMADGIEQ